MLSESSGSSRAGRRLNESSFPVLRCEAGLNRPDGFDLPVKKLDPDRRRGAAGKNVQQRAADGIFSRFIDQRYPKIGRFVESPPKVFGIQFLPDTATDPQPLAKLRARRQAVQQRGRCDEQRPRRPRSLVIQQAGQRFQAPRRDFGMRAEQVVGERFPVGQECHALAAPPQPLHLLHELLHASRLGRDDQHAWRSAGVNQAGADQRRRACADAVQPEFRIAPIRPDNRPDCRQSRSGEPFVFHTARIMKANSPGARGEAQAVRGRMAR